MLAGVLPCFLRTELQALHGHEIPLEPLELVESPGSRAALPAVPRSRGSVSAMSDRFLSLFIPIS